jgi:hypothetical protein
MFRDGPKPANSEQPVTPLGNESGFLTNPLTRLTHRLTGRAMVTRRISFYVFIIIFYVLLDRATVQLEVFPNVSAWYPPVGLLVALIIGLGAEAVPAMVVALYLSDFLNYQHELVGLYILFVDPMIAALYSAAALFLRKHLNAGYRIRTFQDLLRLLGVPWALLCSARRPEP